MTLLRATIIPGYGLQTLSGSPEVNGGCRQNGGPKGNGAPERNVGVEGNDWLEENDGREGNSERGRIEAGQFGNCNSKCSPSIRPCHFRSIDDFSFFTVIKMFVTWH